MIRRQEAQLSAAAMVAIAAIAVCAAVLAGCGGGDDPASAEELIRRGDEICAAGRARFAKVQRELPASPAAAAEQTGELVEIASAELDELRQIRAPDQLRERYEAYLGARRRALDLLERGRAAAEAKNATRYRKAQARAAAAQPERLKLARAVGFEVCSKG